MNAQTVTQALALPKESFVSQRVPKKVLIEQGAPTASDKRNIQSGIDEMHWIAALKPNQIGVAPHQDQAREYLEIAVLTARIHADAKSARLAELIHRAIPYPVLLITEQGSKPISLSLAHKRHAQNEDQKTVLDGEVISAELSGARLDQDFLGTMALSAQPNQNLYALYQGWIDRVEALVVARITGSYKEPRAGEPGARRAVLTERALLERELISLRSQAKKEKQMSRRVELNLGIQKIEQQLKNQLAQL
jgi:hypothetical protein